jgi:hypothetical protein
MLRAMTSAPLGDDVFGDDPTVNRLEETAAVQLPSVHASDAEPGPDLFPAHTLLSRRRPFAAISVDAGQELPLTFRIAPGVRLEPPAAHRLYQRCQVALRARLLEGHIQVLVVSPQHGITGVSR